MLVSAPTSLSLPHSLKKQKTKKQWRKYPQVIFFITKKGCCSIYFLSHTIKWDPATTPIILPVFLHYAWLLGEGMDFPFVKLANSHSCFSERTSCFTSNRLNGPIHPWHGAGLCHQQWKRALTETTACLLPSGNQWSRNVNSPATAHAPEEKKKRTKTWNTSYMVGTVRQLLTPYLMHPFTSS